MTRINLRKRVCHLVVLLFNNQKCTLCSEFWSIFKREKTKKKQKKQKTISCLKYGFNLTMMVLVFFFFFFFVIFGRRRAYSGDVQFNNFSRFLLILLLITCSLNHLFLITQNTDMHSLNMWKEFAPCICIAHIPLTLCFLMDLFTLIIWLSPFLVLEFLVNVFIFTVFPYEFLQAGSVYADQTPLCIGSMDVTSMSCVPTL